MNKWKNTLLLAFKIGIGSSLAIYIAQYLNLNYAISAGTITLLTLMTTKWDTIRLSLYRVATFFLTLVLGVFFFSVFGSNWLSYGLVLMILVILITAFDMTAVLSVNAVIVAHFLSNEGITYKGVINELILVIIGILIALLLNLFNRNSSHEKQIQESMKSTEERLQMILGQLAAYLSGKEMQISVWDDVVRLEADLDEYIHLAQTYQDNTFHSHPEYYISYFKMRHDQTLILHNLHYELKKIRSLPDTAMPIAEYMLYLMDYVKELNDPQKQEEKLQEIFCQMRKKPLPSTREEFENRALLYHVLMDLEEFLVCKRRFIRDLPEEQKYIYWNTKRNKE